jgi:hypothetical protein
MNMMQGKMEEDVIVMIPTPGNSKGLDLTTDILMGQDDSFGLSGGSRRVEDH